MALGVVVVAFGTAAVYLLGRPRLVEASPAPGAQVVPAGTPLRITFSHRMNPDTVARSLFIEPQVEGKIEWEGNTLVFTPQGLWPSGETVQVRLSTGARSAGLLSFALAEPQSWSFTIGRPRLVYLYPFEGPAELYLLNMETGEIERLTTSAGTILDYAVSPDGLTIYYTLSRGDGSSQILRLDMLSRESEQVVECPQARCTSPRPSPDGAWLAYERTLLEGAPEYPQVWLLSLLAPESEPVLVAEEGHETQSPAWSSTGWLAYRDNHEKAFIFFNPASGERERFDNENGLEGVWSPDGESFIISEVVTLIEQNPNTLPDFSSIPSSHLLRYSRRDRSVENLTQRDNLEDASPVYSPDGSMLAFGRKYLDLAHWTPGRQLWVMRADGSEAQPLTEEPHHNHYSFAWHPAGGQIAYVRFNQTLLIEPPELWLIEVGSGRARQLITGGYAPQWIP